MNSHEQIDAYFLKHSIWSEELNLLRKVCLSVGLEESVKWGMPTYTYGGQNVVGLGAFKHHVSLWFFQGCFLKDSKSLLVNAQEGKTKAMRHMKFVEGATLDEETITAYLQESIENHKQGKKVRIERSTSAIEFIIDPHLNEMLVSDTELKHNFEKLSLARQRGFSNYITEVKQQTTKQKRIEKIIPLINAGKPLAELWKKK